MSWTKNVKTTIVTQGSSLTLPNGFASVDLIYLGTGLLCTITGTTPDSVAIPIPPSIPYTLEYGSFGYGAENPPAGFNPVTINNGGNASCYVVIKF